MIVWNAENGKLLTSFTIHKQGINSLAWSFNSLNIATCSDDKTIRIVNINTSTATSCLKGHTNKVLCIDYSLNGNMIVSGSFDETVWLKSIDPRSEYGISKKEKR